MPETIVVSYSELDTARQCLHKHDLAYRQRWSKTPDPGSPLSRGSLWHAVMEAHYRFLRKVFQERGRFGQGLPTADEMFAQIAPLLYTQGQQTEDQQLIEWMYIGYLRMYGLDPEWEILAIEHPLEVWLPTPSGHRSRFKLKAKIDLIVRWQGRIWLVDHKSCKDLPYRKDLDLDDQFGLYTWGLQKVGKRVFGSIHNAARTFRPKTGGPQDDRPRNEQGQYLNKDGTVSKNQPKPQPLDERFSRTHLDRTKVELERIAVEAYQYATIAWQQRQGEAPRSPDTDRCGWRCSYTEACLAGRKGVDELEVLRSTGFVQGLDPITGQPVRH